MSDVGSDLEAAEELVYAAQDRLMAKNKKDKLVSFVLIDDDHEREAAWQKLISEFNKDTTRPPKGVMECAYAMTRYLMALEVALGERPAPTTHTDIQNEGASVSHLDDLPF